MIYEEDKKGSMSCNCPLIDDEMDLWTLLCESVKEQKEKWQRGKSKYFVEDNMDIA